jgi:serine/threonine-protein kinase RsbW
MKTHYIAACSKQSLPKIRAFVEDELRGLEVQENVKHQLVLAVDEACANSIIHHHSCDEHSRIKLTISRKGRELLIELTDNGTPFPINQYQPRDLQEIIKNRTKGGLGIFLINKIMDKVEVIEDQDHFVYRFTKYL